MLLVAGSQRRLGAPRQPSISDPTAVRRAMRGSANKGRRPSDPSTDRVGGANKQHLRKKQWKGVTVMDKYESPAVIATYSIEELVEEATVCMQYGPSTGPGTPG